MPIARRGLQGSAHREPAIHVFAAAAEACRSGRPAAMVTVIEVMGSTPRIAGSRMLVYEDGTSVGTVGGGAFEFRCVGAALEALETGTPRRVAVHLTRDLGMCCGGRMEAFVEPLTVTLPAVLFGAGHVNHATAPLLTGLGFDVTVVDERDELANAERFPGATVVCASPLDFVARHAFDPRTYVLVATHDHKLDQDLVAALLPVPLAYLGLIASRAKVARFLVRYRAAGLDEALFDRLVSPVGLDIGAETPAEIALSIAAEIVARKRGIERAPTPLTDQPLKARRSRSDLDADGIE